MAQAQTVDIVEATQTVTKTYNHLEFVCTEYILDTCATFNVRMFSVVGGKRTLVDTKFITMKDADFAAWGEDDTYVKQWILSQLGLVEL